MSDARPASNSLEGTPYAALVRGNTNFRNLWYGQIVSLFGDWFNLIASASLVGQLTGSDLAVGGLFVIRMLAPFLISPFAGVAADRYDRKKLLVFTDLVRAGIVLGFLLVRTPGEIWLLYTLTALQLAMTGIFFPTRNAILPDIVSVGELGAANALSSATWSVMLALGAAIGGLVSGGWGIAPAFVIDSLTFLLSAFFIGHIRYAHLKHGEGRGEMRPRAVLGEYLGGLGYLVGHPDILVIGLHKAALCLFVAGGYEVVQVAISKDVFVLGEGGGIGLGILYAGIGIGSGMGPLIARRFTGDRDRSLRVALFWTYLIMAAGLGIVAELHSFATVLLGAWLRAVGAGTLWVFSTQLLLQLLPDKVRGRVFATEYAFLTLSMAISAASAGWALDGTGLGIAGLLHVMMALVLIPGLLWGLWILRRGPRGDRSDLPVVAVEGEER